jgi:hypothetical protein
MATSSSTMQRCGREVDEEYEETKKQRNKETKKQAQCHAEQQQEAF